MTVDRTSAHTRPDSLTGALVAFEGIDGVVSVVNAPTGCKFAPGYLVDRQDPREATGDPFEYEEEFFFGQPRVPCTYLDELDYVHGSGPKLGRLLLRLEEKGARLIGVVNGPGTALIGDDIGRIAASVGVKVPVVAVEASGITGSASLGFVQALRGVLDRIPEMGLSSEPRCRVALTGPSLLQLRWQDDLRQLRKELTLAGLTDVASVGAGSSLEELARARRAQVAVPVHESFGGDLAEHVASFGGGTAIPATVLAPVGVEAAEQWLLAVVEAAGGDQGPIRARTNEVRQALHGAIGRFHCRTGLPGGLSCVVATDAAFAAPLVLFLADYLGMCPVGVIVRERAEEAERFLGAFVAERGLGTELLFRGSPLEEEDLFRRLQPDVLFGSSYDLAVARTALGRPVPFVAVSYPELGRVRLTRRPLFGLGGCLTIVEDLLNAIVSLSRTALL